MGSAVSKVGDVAKAAVLGPGAALTVGALKEADKKGAFGAFTAGRKAAEDAANRAQQDAAAQQKAIDDAVAKINEEFGVGDSATAHANAQAEANTEQEVGTATEKATADQANEGFQHQTVANRQALARSGLLNSSVDVGAQRRNLSALIKNRQQAVLAGQNASRDLKMTTEGNRLNLVTQVQNGTLANPDFQAIDQQRGLQLQSALGNVGPQALGTAFTAAGGLIEQNQAAVDRGGGYPSLSLTSGQPRSTPASTGSITGG